MLVKTEEMVEEERALEEFLLGMETVLFCGVVRVLADEEHLTSKKFKITVGASPELAHLVELELSAKLGSSRWGDCAAIDLIIVRGRVAEYLSSTN